MPTYEYMNNAGEIIQIEKPMSEAEPIGTIVEVVHGGKKERATRIYSAQQVQGDNWKPYISHRLPRNLHDCPCTPEGKPIVTTKKQERDIMARFGYERE